MKRYLFTGLLLLFFVGTKAQTTPPPPPPPPPDVDTPGKVDSLIRPVEQDPEFPGGVAAFFKFLGENIKYPETAWKNKIQGRVVVSFVVEKDGSLTDVKITRGVSPDLDDEAMRLIKSSPKWKPGIQNGKLVRVMYSVPINFSLH